MGTLRLVSTPVGNLSDLTRRAREVLAGADRVLAEDTRRTRILLDEYGIEVPLVSLHEHNEFRRAREVVGWLDDGEEVALVSDAGTPLISDPGERLVREVLDAGHGVSPVPGPSAVTAALVASGLPTDRFAFLGFPPRSGEARDALLDRVATSAETTVLFEAPGRLHDLLSALEEACGPERRVAVAREVTKVHEEFVRGTLGEARAYYEGSPPRGEVTVVVASAPEPARADDVDEAAAAALGRALLSAGRRRSAAAREIARRLGIPRNRAYEIVHEIPEPGTGDGEPPPG